MAAGSRCGAGPWTHSLAEKRAGRRRPPRATSASGVAPAGRIFAGVAMLSGPSLLSGPLRLGVLPCAAGGLAYDARSFRGDTPGVRAPLGRAGRCPAACGQRALNVGIRQSFVEEHPKATNPPPLKPTLANDSFGLDTGRPDHRNASDPKSRLYFSFSSCN
jgi:hypothetical protein